MHLKGQDTRTKVEKIVRGLLDIYAAERSKQKPINPADPLAT
jgi:hypothetical protein